MYAVGIVYIACRIGWLTRPDKCPICNSKMRKISVGKEESILLDQCKHNHGFWFDSGEIFDVIKFGSIDKNNKVIKMLEDMYKNEINLKVEEE